VVPTQKPLSGVPLRPKKWQPGHQTSVLRKECLAGLSFSIQAAEKNAEAGTNWVEGTGFSINWVQVPNEVVVGNDPY